MNLYRARLHELSIFNLRSARFSRLSQILKDQLHLPSSEVPILGAVARSEQLVHQAIGIVDISIEAAQRIGCRSYREVHRGQLALRVRSDCYLLFHNFIVFVIDFVAYSTYAFHPIKLQIINEICKKQKLYFSHRPNRKHRYLLIQMQERSNLQVCKVCAVCGRPSKLRVEEHISCTHSLITHRPNRKHRKSADPNAGAKRPASL